MSSVALAWALPAVPFATAVLGLLLPAARPRRWTDRAYRGVAAALGVAGAATALVVAVLLVTDVAEPVEGGVEWVTVGPFTVTAGVLLDRPAVLVALAVTAVACAVQVYSVAYLGPAGEAGADDRYAPYAAQVSLFTAAMLLVVVSGDLILLLVGWEVMGICSYLLIGHDRRLPEAPAAAVKAFLVTRVGDVGFLLGIAVLGIGAGSFRITEVLAAQYPPGTLTVAGLLLLCGVAGKSAQFPLHTWLPDAMAGPTPISALIHAATMVAAGVYVVARLFPLFAESPVTLAVLGLLAAVTLLLGAFTATAQDDIKRVLAWSTVSQLGYMTGALAVGAPSAALFHLLTHAAFKALLFLSAGAVIHAVGSNLMSRMGGLRRELPQAFWLMTIGLAALAGVPPLAGFWSKETVLVAAAHARDGHGPGPAWVALIVWLAALLGVAVTAFYAVRLLLRTFFGTSAAHPAPAEAHHVPALMYWPMAVLAVPAAVLGVFALAPGFRTDLGLVAPHADVAVLAPLLLTAAGAAVGWWAWRRATHPVPVAAAPADPGEPTAVPAGTAAAVDRAPAGTVDLLDTPGLAAPVDLPGTRRALQPQDERATPAGPEPVDLRGTPREPVDLRDTPREPVDLRDTPREPGPAEAPDAPVGAGAVAGADPVAGPRAGAATAPPAPTPRRGRAVGGAVGGGLRAAFAQAFWLDAAQHVLVVRPVRALAALTSRADERLVDGAVEGTGRGATRLGGWLAVGHRAALPRAAVAVLAGAVLLGLAAVILGGTP